MAVTKTEFVVQRTSSAREVDASARPGGHRRPGADAGALSASAVPPGRRAWFAYVGLHSSPTACAVQPGCFGARAAKAGSEWCVSTPKDPDWPRARVEPAHTGKARADSHQVYLQNVSDVVFVESSVSPSVSERRVDRETV